MTTFEILNKRFPSTQYAIMEEVSDMAGFNRSRSADYVIMSLWPSRGLDLIGVERKSFRGDWLSELKKPAKAENIFQYCDCFYLLTDNEGVAKIEEIPQTWGWMSIKNGKLKIEKEAPKLTPITMSRHFMAALLKRASSKEGYTRNESIKDKIEESFESGRGSGKNDYNRLNKQFQELSLIVSDFEKASGIELKNYPRWMYTPTKIGEIVKLIGSGGITELEKRIEDLLPTVTKIQGDIENRLKLLKSINNEDAVTK